MLFNCFICCKAISSNAASCPYCMVETTPMVQQMEVEKPTSRHERSEVPLFPSMKSIPQLLQRVRMVHR